MMKPQHFEKMLVFSIALSMLGIFLLDLQTPLGVADGTLYILPIALTLWMHGRLCTIISAVVSLVLIILGYYCSPDLDSLHSIAVANRGLAVLIVLLGTIFVLSSKNKAFIASHRKKFLEAIVSDSFDAIVKIDSSGKVIGWNKSSEKMFGWLYNEAFGMELSELIIPHQYRQTHREGMRKFLALGTRGIINQHIEITALRKDGFEFPVELTVSAIKLENEYAFSAVVRDITERKRLEKENQIYAFELGKALKKEKLQLFELKNAYLQTLSCLSLTAEFKDMDTGKHLVRISKYCEILAKGAGLGEEETKAITTASPMHDIGKIGIPDKILQKTHKLTESEFDVIKQHTLIGAEILGNSEAPIIGLAREIALSHHEKWNGRGYPKGIAGDNIPLPARIVALVDCFDALTSARPYKNPYPLEMAYDIIVNEEGKSFDPCLVRLFMERFEEFRQVAIDHFEENPNDLPFQMSSRDREGLQDNKARETEKVAMTNISDFDKNENSV